MESTCTDPFLKKNVFSLKFLSPHVIPQAQRFDDNYLATAECDLMALPGRMLR